MVVLADVTNPLVGRDGAAPVYGPQKGASEADVDLLERALARWSDIAMRDLGRRVADLPGGGAAGGLGAAFAAYLGAPPSRGADWLLEAVGFDELLARTHLVITGEGAWDLQSSMGKITGEVVARAGGRGSPSFWSRAVVRGDLPRGVQAATGGGGVLDAAAMTALVRARAPALLQGSAGP
jgi:glycerate 2-kinase